MVLLSSSSSSGRKPSVSGMNRQTWCMVLMSAMGGALFGYHTAIVSGAMIFVKAEFTDVDHVWQEAIVSVTILFAWLLSMTSAAVSDRWGRRVTILLSAGIFAAGSLVMGIAGNKWILLTGRGIVGAAIGWSSTIVPLYIAEMAPSSIRGSLVTANTAFTTGGQCLSLLVALLSSTYLPQWLAWRLMLSLPLIPAVVQFTAFLTLMPESP